jgi:multidrug efflux pump subunit AcrB
VNGVNYNVAVQTPQSRISSLDALMRTPISAPLSSFNATTAGSASGSAVVTSGSVGSSPTQTSMAYGNPGALQTQGSEQFLSNIATTGQFDNKLPKGSAIDVRGQILTMQTSFYRLGLGLIFSVILVYFLMAVNFQSWLDPFIILMALPGALAGIVWMLFVTQTTFSVPSMMGAIMCIGVATANSILMVVFANDQRLEGMDQREAALAAGNTRIRPVLMTAAAMIIGMLPMALGMGEGGEQNAPLGRAVIGGLMMATFTTLFAVPIVYSLLRHNAPVDFDQKLIDEEHEDVTGFLNQAPHLH